MKWTAPFALAIWASALAIDLPLRSISTDDLLVADSSEGQIIEDSKTRQQPLDTRKHSAYGSKVLPGFLKSLNKEEVNEAARDLAYWLKEDDNLNASDKKKRIRRTFMPRGGSTLMEHEKEKKQNRNKSVPTRNKNAAKGLNTETVINRAQDPQGSENLYSLHPEFRPGYYAPKLEGKGRSQVTKTSAPEKVEIVKKELPKEYSLPIEREHFLMDEQSPKKKWSKEMKNEIADYALKHGVDEALAHYKNKGNRKLKRKTIDKFINRYKRREMRRKSRGKGKE